MKGEMFISRIEPSMKPDKQEVKIFNQKTNTL